MGRSKRKKTNLAFDWQNASVDELNKLEAKVETQKEAKLQSLQNTAVALWKKEQSNTVELGKSLLAIKAMVDHGEFKKWWTKEGMNQGRVSYCMRVADPKGNKVKEAKEKTQSTPRAKALGAVNKKLAQLWSLAEAGEGQKARELFDEVVAEIRARFMPKAKAQNA
jgi:hypothetical protein